MIKLDALERKKMMVISFSPPMINFDQEKYLMKTETIAIAVKFSKVNPKNPFVIRRFLMNGLVSIWYPP